MLQVSRAVHMSESKTSRDVLLRVLQVWARLWMPEEAKWMLRMLQLPRAMQVSKEQEGRDHSTV